MYGYFGVMDPCDGHSENRRDRRLQSSGISTAWPNASARPRLITYDGVVAQHLGDGGPDRKQPRSLGRAHLELATVLDYGRAEGAEGNLSIDPP